MDFYNSLEQCAGWLEYYLFEDYPYVSANVLEKPEKRIIEMLKQDKSLHTYKLNGSLKDQLRYNLKYNSYKLLIKARGALGI